MPPLWLLDTSSYERHRGTKSKYAILSHRWKRHPRFGDEIDFQALNPSTLSSHTTRLHQQDSDEDRACCPLCKIKDACAKAREQRIQWLWIDTCCIDKMNAVEYTRAINSMFEYYREAYVCFAFLYDVAWQNGASSVQMFKSQDPERPGLASEWFERGWTLQELLAPRHMEFYDRKWTLMGTKQELAQDLDNLTRIDKKYLLENGAFKKASVATRLSWMAGRTTEYIEDIAYSMLGIMDVNMPAQYGEGAKAFMMLQRMVIENSSDESIFAWTIPTEGLKCYRGLGELKKWTPSTWGLLAPSPDCFRGSRDLVVADRVSPRPYSWAQKSVQFSLPIRAGTEARNWLGLPRKEVKLGLNCCRQVDGKTLYVVIHLLKTNNDFVRVQCGDMDLTKKAPRTNSDWQGVDQVIREALNVLQPDFDPSDLILYQR